MQIFGVGPPDKGRDVLLVAACVVMSSQMGVEVVEDVQILKGWKPRKGNPPSQTPVPKGQFPQPYR